MGGKTRLRESEGTIHPLRKASESRAVEYLIQTGTAPINNGNLHAGGRE